MDEHVDPFRHHPELRGRIRPAEESFFRGFLPADMDADMAARGIAPGWPTPDADREAGRRRLLSGHRGDLWIFGYGSLMWDPALRFTKVRRARLDGYSRRFCLKDTLGARGTAERPGLMAGLAVGGTCEGLAFRVAAGAVEAETEILWRREMIAPGYTPVFAAATLDDGAVRALTFVADPAAPHVDLALAPGEQARLIATGTGFLGSSLDYIDNLAAHLETLGIEDPELCALRGAARALAAGPA